MTILEHREIRGITIKNMVVTILSTASIVVSVMTTYFNLKSDVQIVKDRQETTERVNEIRLKVLERNVDLLKQEIHELKTIKS